MNQRQKEIQQQFLDSEKAVLKKLEYNYRIALADIDKNLEALMARNDADMQNVIYRIEHQKALKTQVQAILEQLQANEFETVSEYLANAYTDGFVGTMYDLHGQGVPLILPIDQEQVVDAIKHNTKLSEGLYASLGKDIKEMNKQIAGEISRGIAAGMGFGEIARNIENYTNIPKNNAMRIARTESHRIQCNAACDAQFKAKEKGADVVKQWDSYLDGRTRDSHREIDGQIRELDELFEVNGHKAMFPGDFGRPEEDINCRCAILQRARWNLGEAELQRLKERAEYYELDKTEQFEDFKKKYLKASERVREDARKIKGENATETLKNKEKNGKIIKRSSPARIIDNRVKVTQQRVDELVNGKLSGVRFSATIEVNNRISDFGQTKIVKPPVGKTKVEKIIIGKQKDESEAALIDTLIHEELEARIALRANGSEFYRRLDGASDNERHAYINKVIARFMKGRF